ncbi:hypothetical protein SORBI_3005G017632 [Sorghum bicolor]|uniref:Uncharacterized protein n=1 Tax=Sorghum bicolor TaxID=4558 RepID=C5Y3L2_SORBI|nr:hypothetical protein SORBI_3005G017632 [Sorghum bicolor]
MRMLILILIRCEIKTLLADRILAELKATTLHPYLTTCMSGMDELHLPFEKYVEIKQVSFLLFLQDDVGTCLGYKYIAAESDHRRAMGQTRWRAIPHARHQRPSPWCHHRVSF